MSLIWSYGVNGFCPGGLPRMTSKKGQGIVPSKRKKQNINRGIIPDPLLAAFKL